MSQTSTMQRILGTWHADLKRWDQLVPPQQGIGLRFLFKFIVANVKVTFTEDTLTIAGYGAGPPKIGTYRVLSDDGSTARLEVKRGEQTGIYTVEVHDDTHITLRLIEPKSDVMALKRNIPVEP